MLYRLAADLVLASHFLFVIVAVFGGILVLIWRGWWRIHLPIVIWSSVVNLASWTCPLTPLENRFRLAAGKVGYQGGFIEHYLMPLVYPGGMTRRMELIAGVSVLLWNLVLYLGLIWKLRRRTI